MTRTTTTLSRAMAAFVVAALAATGVAATASDAGAATGDGTGPPPKGLGRGSSAALAQDTCNESGRTSFVYVGTGPWCVNPWPEGKDNGGATAPGVTATGVKVVVYQPNEAMDASQKASGVQTPSNQGTKAPATIEEATVDAVAAYEYAIETYGTYQLWGRAPVYEFVTATGSDEAAQRADAVAVIEKKPFMVIDASHPTTGAEVFTATLAARKILVTSPSTTAESAEKQSPYRWNSGQDPDAAAYLTASFLGRSLAGEKAKWAGDDLATKTRSFAAVYPSTGLDIDAFATLLKKNGGPALVDAVEYDSSDPAKFEEAAPTLLAKLKAAGATTVVLFADPSMVRALMAAAASQEYTPEWIVTGYGFHDFDGFARTNDADQMKHAFGVGVLPPSYAGSTGSSGVFPWYWGLTQGNYAASLNGAIGFVYASIHYAGPTLTAANVKKGLFSVPATGGASDGTTNFQSGYGKTVKLPYDAYSALGSDRNLAWWNPDISGGANAVASFVGKGKFMYLNDGKRFAYGQFPTAQPKFFDASASVSEIPRSSNFADGVVPPDNPCTGCPSSGGAAT